MKPQLTSIIFAACLASCSAQYHAPSRGNEAVIVNRPAGIAAATVSRKLLTNIEKIDGQTTPWAMAAFQEYKVSPGHHVIRTSGISRRDTSNTEIGCDFKPNQKYTLSGYTDTSTNRLVHVYEIKDAQERVVARKSPDGVNSDYSTPIFIPIITH